MIWFDLDNSPHVPLYRPVFEELKRRNEKFLVTARDYAQTLELLNLWNIEHIPVGKHGGKNKIMKVLNLFKRAGQLKKIIKNKNISLAVSHGSRTQLITSKRLKIPSILMADYEYTETKIFNALADNIYMPVYIPDDRLEKAGFRMDKIIRYDGFKEELYLSDFEPDNSFREKLNISDETILAVFRPPALAGNYHDNRSEKFLIEGLKYFSSFDNVTCLIISRTELDRKYISENLEMNDSIRFLEEVVDGLQLLYSADYTISGGGTMNRESALLGTKTYSIFTGKRPYLDEYLNKSGKLTFIESADDFKSISVERNKKHNNPLKNSSLVEQITNKLISFGK